MRKATLFIFACILVLTLFLLCSCSDSDKTPEKIDKSIGEMTFVLSGELKEVRNEDRVIQIFIDQGTYESEDHFNEWVDEAQYYYGKGYDLSISTSYVQYMNDEIDQCMQYSYGDTIERENAQNIDIDGMKGKLGHYSIDSTENYYLHILCNGLYYEFNMSFETGKNYPKNYLEDIAATIEFNAIGKKDVSCGDIVFSIPKNYQVLDFEEEEGVYDEQYYGQFGDTYSELGISYMWSEGATVKEAADEIDESAFEENGLVVHDLQHSTEEYALGTYELFIGSVENSGTLILGMFEYEGKIYTLSFYCENKDNLQFVESIMQSISVTI